MRKRILGFLLLLSALAFCSPVEAEISFDAASEGTGTSALSWTHTPVGAPKGVFVFCINNTVSTDVFSGATYGGVAMTQKASAADTSGEPGFTEGYFLGASIPTGAQTVACTVSTGSTAKWGVAITVTAASDTQPAGTGACSVSNNVANPSCSITGISGASYGAAGHFSGQANESSITAGSGMTKGPGNDFGSMVTASEYSTAQQGSGNMTIGFTVATDDVAMVAIAVEQTTPDVSVKRSQTIVVFNRAGATGRSITAARRGWTATPISVSPRPSASAPTRTTPGHCP